MKNEVGRMGRGPESRSHFSGFIAKHKSRLLLLTCFLKTSTQLKHNLHASSAERSSSHKKRNQRQGHKKVCEENLRRIEKRERERLTRDSREEKFATRSRGTGGKEDKTRETTRRSRRVTRSIKKRQVLQK